VQAKIDNLKATKTQLRLSVNSEDITKLQNVNTQIAVQKNKLAELRVEAKKLEDQNLP